MEIENKTLGLKLIEANNFFANNPKYFINNKTLELITKLITAIRNDVVHSDSKIEKNKDIAAIQSYLSSQLSITFLQFTIKTLTSFMDKNGNFVDVEILKKPSDEEANTIFYFGFDGDATGDYLELAFGDSSQDESEVLKRSQRISDAINLIKKIIRKATKDKDSILFAEGDNVLFKAKYDPLLLNNLQKAYSDFTELSSSIGYGKNLREATIAMRLAKAKRGDSIVGVALKNFSSENK